MRERRRRNSVFYICFLSVLYTGEMKVWLGGKLELVGGLDIPECSIDSSDHCVHGFTYLNDNHGMMIIAFMRGLMVDLHTIDEEWGRREC